MQYESPVYADGIIKNRQDRFGGLNHNPGAGDGQLYEMHNLGSDYYPLLATRAKRRKYRELTKCNGIFAAEELCWVDGTEFFYGGIKKGDVEDSRKSFTAINGIVIILPDRKYYDTVEDRFGDLGAALNVTDLEGETVTWNQAQVDGTPMVTETYTEIREQPDTSSPAVFGAYTGDSAGLASLLRFDGSAMAANISRPEVGTITISGCSIEENNGTFQCLGKVYYQGYTWLRFEENAFTEGTADGQNTVTLEINRPGQVIWTSADNTNKEKTAWAIYPDEDSVTGYSTMNWNEEGFSTGKRVRISGSSYEKYNGVFEIKSSDSQYQLHFQTDDTTGDTGTAEYRNGITFTPLLAKPATFTEDTLTVPGETWSEIFMVGESVTISGCSIEENNGTYTVTEIDDSANSIRFEASFTAGSDNGYALKLESERSGPVFRSGTLYGVDATANTIYIKGIDWSDYFRVGDAVEISGCSLAANNKTLIVREIDGEELRFYENSFVTGVDGSRETVIRRNVPELLFAFECENRIWGFEGQTVHASKLGDPFNFNVYDGLETDSWAVDMGDFEAITGGREYQGYPTFLKDGGLYKVYGNVPSNFELIRVATTGCAPGCEKSLAVAGETLFWMNWSGIAAYAGGLPTLINAPFGTERYRNAVAGSDGEKYYVSAEDRNGVWHLFVYDVRRGLWHEEDNTEAVGFSFWDGNLYYADSEGNIMVTGNLKFYPVDSEEEENFDWWAEFTDFVDDSPNKKGINKFQIRMELDEDKDDPPRVTVKLMMDSDGEWIIPEGGTIENAEKRSYILPIIPRRADHYKLRIEGHGGCRIYSIAKEYYQGSDFKSQPGRH